MPGPHAEGRQASATLRGLSAGSRARRQTPSGFGAIGTAAWRQCRDASIPVARLSRARLGNECLPNRCGGPSVRAVNRWNLPPRSALGDVFERHPLPEHRVDLYPPLVVASVAEPMREPDVVGGEVTSVHLEPRIVVGRRLPIRTRCSRVEVAAAPEAVALGHLAPHVDDLPIPGKLPKDSVDLQSARVSRLPFLP